MKTKMFNPQGKLLWHVPRIAEWLKGKNVAPVLIEFDPSNRCNHRCSFCTFKYLKDRSVLEKDIMEKTIKDFAKMGVKAINWTGGGEPLTNKDLLYIMELAHKKGIEQGLFINGILLDDNWIKTILKTHTWMRFSIDAGTRENYKMVRGVDDWEKLIKNVKRTVELKKRLRSKTTIGVGFVVTPDNFKEIEIFAKEAKKWNVDYCQFKPCIENCFATAQLERDWWANEVTPRLEEASKINEKVVVNLYKLKDISNPEADYGRSYKECYGHIFCPCIGADGNVWLCTHLRGFKEYSFGNLHEKSFEEIWNSKRRQDVIKKIDFRKCQPCCKNHEINKLLYFIKNPQKSMHPNFL